MRDKEEKAQLPMSWLSEYCTYTIGLMSREYVVFCLVHIRGCADWVYGKEGEREMAEEERKLESGMEKRSCVHVYWRRDVVVVEW